MKNKALICLFLSIVVLLVILIIYKNTFKNEAFSNPPSPYDNGKVYSVGDVVIQDGVIYIMKDGIGAAGYPPPRPTNWAPLPSANLCSPVEYNNGTVYKVGDVVSMDKLIYVMIDGIGAAGYPPPRPTNWTLVSPESIKTLCVAAAPPPVVMQAPAPVVMQAAAPVAMQAPAPVAAAPAPVVIQAPAPAPVAAAAPIKAAAPVAAAAATKAAAAAPMKAVAAAPMKAVAAAPTKAVAAAPTKAAAPVKAPPARARMIKKEGFSAVSNSFRSDIANSLPFGPADFSSDINPSADSSSISFVRNTKYDRTLSNDGDFLNPFTEN